MELWTHFYARREMGRNGQMVVRFYAEEATQTDKYDAIRNLSECMEYYGINRQYSHTTVTDMDTKECWITDLSDEVKDLHEERLREEMEDRLFEREKHSFFYSAR